MNPLRARYTLQSGVNEKLSEGPSSFWMAAVVILNVVIFAGFGYVLWTDIDWDLE